MWGTPPTATAKEAPPAVRAVTDRTSLRSWGGVLGTWQSASAGSDGSPQGGWAFRYGSEAVVGDKFGLGEVLDTGAMLLGRRTWELFAKIWPGRDDPFRCPPDLYPGHR